MQKEPIFGFFCVLNTIMSDRIYYLNPRINRANLVEEYTAEQIMEYKKCAEDPVYFIENYVKVRSVDHGLVSFDLRGYQSDLIKTYNDNRNSIVLSSRQSGKCVCINTPIRVRNKMTGEILETTIGEFYEKLQTIPT